MRPTREARSDALTERTPAFFSSDHGVIGRDAHTETQRGRPPVWEGRLRRHHGLRSEQGWSRRMTAAVRADFWRSNRTYRWVFLSLCFRDNRWSSRRGGLPSTKRSTSPRCTPAGLTHRVNAWKRANLLQLRFLIGGQRLNLFKAWKKHFFVPLGA